MAGKNVYGVFLTFMEYVQLCTRGNLSVFCERCRGRAGLYAGASPGAAMTYEVFLDYMRRAPYCGLSPDAYVFCLFASDTTKTALEAASRRFLIELRSTLRISPLCALGGELIAASSGTHLEMPLAQFEEHWQRYCLTERNTDAWYKAAVLRDLMDLPDAVFQTACTRTVPTDPQDEKTWRVADFGTDVAYPDSAGVNRQAKYLNTRCYGWILTMLAVHERLKAVDENAARDLHEAGNDVNFRTWVKACLEAAKFKRAAAQDEPLLEAPDEPEALKRWRQANWGLEKATEAGPDYYAVVLHYGALAANEERLNLVSLKADLKLLADEYGGIFSTRALFLIADSAPYKLVSELREKAASGRAAQAYLPGLDPGEAAPISG